MSAKIAISIPVEPELAAKLDAAIHAKSSAGGRVTRAGFIRDLIAAHLANQPVPPRRARDRSGIAAA